MEVTQYAPGTFCWAELSTSDSAGAKKFYTDLFGWSVNEIPMDQGPPYVIFQQNGKNVGAMMENKQVPPNWLSYVSIANVDDAVAKAKKLGANVMMGPMDVMDAGRMAVVVDPQGATFALWQPGKHIGATLVNTPNSVAWNELYAADPAAAKKFYTSLFGWTTKDSPEYTEFHNGDRPAGGMIVINDEMKAAGVPPHWLVYFAVADCDATVKKGQAGGATLRIGPMDIPSVGRFAILADPQGAGFAVIKLTMGA